MFSRDMNIESFDEELFDAIKEECQQEEHIELIASEELYEPRCRLRRRNDKQICGRLSEKRYYGGCENVDIAEELA